MTRLKSFLELNDVKVDALADLAGVSRQHLYRLRYGRQPATRADKIWLTLACRRLLGREVLLGELFDCGDVR